MMLKVPGVLKVMAVKKEIAIILTKVVMVETIGTTLKMPLLRIHSLNTLLPRVRQQVLFYAM